MSIFIDHVITHCMSYELMDTICPELETHVTIHVYRSVLAVSYFAKEILAIELAA